LPAPSERADDQLILVALEDVTHPKTDGK